MLISDVLLSNVIKKIDKSYCTNVIAENMFIGTQLQVNVNSVCIYKI